VYLATRLIVLPEQVYYMHCEKRVWFCGWTPSSGLR